MTIYFHNIGENSDEKIKSIRKEGLKPFKFGLDDDFCVWLTIDKRIACDHFSHPDRIILEVNGDNLDPNQLIPFYGTHNPKKDAVAENFKYLLNIPVSELRISENENWGDLKIRHRFLKFLNLFKI